MYRKILIIELFINKDNAYLALISSFQAETVVYLLKYAKAEWLSGIQCIKSLLRGRKQCKSPICLLSISIHSSSHQILIPSLILFLGLCYYFFFAKNQQFLPGAQLAICLVNQLDALSASKIGVTFCTLQNGHVCANQWYRAEYSWNVKILSLDKYFKDKVSLAK